MVRSFIFSLLSICVAGILTSCDRSEPATGGSATTVSASSDRCPHDIRTDKCPFCTASLIESEGFCGEHGVPEALCYQCRPYLKTAFRNKGDWCAQHDRPDSQCTLCHPELAETMKPGSGHATAPPSDTSDEAEPDHDHDEDDHNHNL